MTGVSAQTEVTFSATTDISSELTLTKSGVTITLSSGTLSRGDNYRCYSGGTMTVSSTVGNITSIVITCTGNNKSSNGPGNFSATGYTYASKVGTWTGEATSVTLSASAQVRMTEIVVTVAGSGGTDPDTPTFAFSADSYTAVLGATDNKFPTLTNTYGTEVAYESSNENVAMIDIDNGDIVLMGAGTTTITAIDDTHEASYTLTVESPLANLAALRAALTSSSADYYVTLTNAVVTCVDGRYAYIEEGETGILFYQNSHTLVDGNVLNGTVKVAAYQYSQCDEITSLEGATITTGGTIPVTEVTIAELIADVDKYESRRVKIVGAEVTTALSSNNATLTQSDNSLGVYCTVSAENLGTVGLLVDAIGYLYTYSSSAQLRVWENPTLNANSRIDPALSFSETSVSVKEGETFTAPELTNTYNVAVTYTSSNTDVATVDVSTGAVTLTGGLGTTTITATSEETSEYLAGEASYTLTVKSASSTTYEDVITYSSLGYTTTSGYANFSIAASSTTSGVSYVGNACRNGNSYIQIRTANSNSGVVSTSNEKGLKVRKVVVEWVESPSGGSNTGKVIDVYGHTENYSGPNAANLYATAASNQGTEIGSIEFGKSTELEIPDGYTAIGIRSSSGVLYLNKITITWEGTASEKTGELTIGTEEGYGTFYNDAPIVLPEGLTATTVTGVTDGKLATAWEYNAGDEIPANTGLLLKGEKGTYTYTILSSTEATVSGTNYLRGSVEAETTTGGSIYYKLTYNSTEGEKVLGFYWGAEDGGAFTNAAHKAYLALPTSLAAQFKGFAFGEDTATGISTVEQDSNEAAAIYTLGGVRLNSNLKALPKGVYIVNGKKVIK